MGEGMEGGKISGKTWLTWATPVLAPKVSFLKIPQSLANQVGQSPSTEGVQREAVAVGGIAWNGFLKELR